MATIPQLLKAGVLRGVEQTVTWSTTDKAANVALSNDNKDMTCNSASFGSCRATLGRSSGFYYFETYCVSAAGSSRTGFGNASFTLTTFLGNAANAVGVAGLALNTTGYTIVGADGGSTTSTGDVHMFAIDFVNGKAYVGRNGTWRASGDPAAGLNHSVLFSGTVYPAASSYSPGDTYRLRTKLADFSYSPPNGYQAWAANT